MAWNVKDAITKNFLFYTLVEGTLGDAERRNIAENIDKYRYTAKKKNRQISQYRIESRWNTEIAKTRYIIHIMRSRWQELRGLGFTMLNKYFFAKFITFFFKFDERKLKSNILLLWLYNGLQVFFVFFSNQTRCFVPLSLSGW